MSVFWDTNLFIYLLEAHPYYAPRVASLRLSARNESIAVCTSTLTLGELSVRPGRLGEHALVRDYESVLLEAGVDLIPFDTAAARYYSRLRSEVRIRPPDAIQLACATAAGVSSFYTNDRGLHNVRLDWLPEIRGL